MTMLRPKFHGLAEVATRCLRQTPIAAAVAAVLYVKPAALVYAAEEATEEAQQQVIVTASRRSENIQDIPLNISAVTSDTIDALRLDKIDALTHWVPGVAMQDQGPWGSSTIVIRGLNTDTLGARGAGSGDRNAAVATYMGEVPLFIDFKLLDMERVEVLLGPQGTLYGAGTLAGAVRYIPNKPNLTSFSADARTRVYSLAEGSGAGYEGDVVLNVPLVEGKLAARAVAGYYNDPGFIDYSRLVRQPGISNPQPNFADPNDVSANLFRSKDRNYEWTKAARLSLLYRPVDAVDAVLTYVTQETKTGGEQITSDPLLGVGRYESGTRFAEPAKRNVDLVSLELTADLRFAQLVSASSYAERTIRDTWDQTDLLLEFEYGYENFPQFVAFNLGDHERKLYTQELRLVSPDTGSFKWIVGAFYNHIKDDNTDNEFVPGYPAFAGINRPDEHEWSEAHHQKLIERAAFGEVGYRLTDAWQVTAGGRAFRYSTSDLSSFATPLIDGSAPNVVDLAANAVSVSDSASSSIFKLNTSYKFTPDLMLYATLSEGYRNGTINSIIPCPPGTDPNSGDEQHPCALPDEQSAKPDRTINHELGARTTWFDKRLTFNAAVYYTSWKDVRVEGATKVGQGEIIVNGSRAASKGIELQFQAVLPRQFKVMGNYTYNDARLTERAPGLVSDFNGTVDGESGDRLPGSPQHMGSLLLQYARTLPGGYALDADYGVSAISNQFTKIGLRASGEKLAGYTVHEASVGLTKDNWRVSLFGENLFNKYAFTGTDGDRSELLTINGFVDRGYFHSVLRPRQIGLELSAHF